MIFGGGGHQPSRAVELGPPPGEHGVNVRGADDRLVGNLQPPRMEDERPRLRAADPAVEGDELLEGTAFVHVRVVEAPDHDVGYVFEGVGALRGAAAAVGEKFARGSSPSMRPSAR